MWSRIGRALLLMMLLTVGASSAWSQSTSGGASSGIAVRPAQNRMILVEPGTLATVVFSIENRSTEPVRLEPSLLLPEGWRTAAPLLSLEIEPGGSDIALASFVAPQSARAGRYEIELSLTTAGTEEPIAPAVATVEIEQRLGVDLEVLRSPQTALSGEEFDVVFLLSNPGNVNQRFDLAVESGRSFPYELSTDAVELEAGASREISVTVKPPPDLSGTTRYFLRLEARSAVYPELSAEARQAVEVIAATAQGTTWHRLPTTLGWSSAYDASASAEEPLFSHALSFSGRGSIDDRGRHELAFSLAPPVFPPGTGNAPYDREYAWEEGAYRGEYSNELFGVRIGDGEYSLTGLTSGSDSGRGVEAYVTPGAFTIGGYGVGADQAVYVGYEPDDLNELRLGLFRDREEPPDPIISLGGSLTRYDAATVDFETAVGTDSPDNYAFDLGIEGEISQFSYELDAAQASPDFGGTRRDYEYYAVASSLEVLKDVRLRGGAARERNNLDLDPDEYSALAADDTWLGVRWKPLAGMSLAGSWQGALYRDLLPERDARRRTDATSVEWNWTKDDLRLETGATFNVHRNLAARTAWKSQAYSLAGSYRAAEALRLSGSARIDSGAARPGFADARTSWSLGATYVHRKRTSLNAEYTHRLDRDQDYRRSSDIAVSMRHSFPSSASLSLSAGASFGTENRVEETVRAELSYHLPVDIPVSPRSDIGAVRGRVVDARTGEGIAGVIVSVGSQTAVTAADGAFLFPAVEVGAHDVRTSVARLDRLLVPVTDMPLQVAVRRQESSLVDVQMVAPGALSGRIVKYEIDRARTNPFSDAPPAYKAGGGLRGVIVEVEGPGGTRRSQTDHDGRFLFRSIIPGEWTVRIYDDGVPEGYTVEPLTMDVVVEAEGNSEVEFAARAPSRRMRILDQGEVREE